ncbi:MAG: DUF5686 and carboxypeptidase regulatory-like domain-containing protein [Bacteroidales bacterium]|jgi:DNA-binding protein H-NS|nr:DUF5686 and carboxypeptidase regulatory-like domain-containing protein [Bacteroidales bacterium]
MKKQLFIVFMTLFCVNVFAGGVKGVIKDEKGAAVPFASIYIAELSIGTTTNDNGEYSIKVPDGNYTFHVRFLGYRSIMEKISVSGWIVKNMVLEPQAVEIPVVVVSNKSEDPAYYIMRHAIGMKEYYVKQVQKYSARVYLKGGAQLKKLPKMFAKQLDVDTGSLGVVETLSDIYFEQPNKLEEKVISMRSSGEMGENPMRFAMFNIYNIETLDVISPLSVNAFSYYKYKLIGSYQDNGRLVNKIKIIPKRKGKDLIKGVIHIAEDFWNIQNSDIFIQTPVGEVNVKEVYSPVESNVWLPLTKGIDMEGKFMGVVFAFNYVASIDNYKITLNPEINHGYLREVARKLNPEAVEKVQKKSKPVNVVAKVPEKSKDEKVVEELLKKDELTNSEMRKLARKMSKLSKKDKKPEPLEIVDDIIEIADDARNKSTAFWDSIRSVPLLSHEIKSFEEKDSIDKIRNSPEYKDSVRMAKKKLTFRSIIWGKTFEYRDDSVSLAYGGLLDYTDGIRFNAVDGLAYSQSLRFYKKQKSGHRYNIKGNVGYAFSREALIWRLSFFKTYSKMRRGKLMVATGVRSTDFVYGDELSMLNSSWSLMNKDNLSRLYEESYFGINNNIDIANGLVLDVGVRFSDRKILENNTNFSFFKYDDLYEPNTPDNVHYNSNDFAFNDNRAFIVHVGLKYRPRYRYRIVDGKKQMAYSRYPTFRLNYYQAIDNVFGSDNRYSKIDFSVEQNISTGMMSSFVYKLKTGAFINKDKVGFQDFNHVKSNYVFLYTNNDITRFGLLPYHKYSSTDAYILGAVGYNTGRLLLKRLPLLNNTLIQESITLRYYNSNTLKNYTEISYGLKQIWFVLNAEVYVGFKDFEYDGFGFKLGMPLF